MRKKLTKTVCDRAKYPHAPASNRRFVMWDSECRGFGLRVYGSGKRAFIFRCEVNGRQRWVQIGDYPPMTVQQARKRADKMRVQAQDGDDPVEERKRQRAKGKTIADVADDYLEVARTTIKPATLASYRDYVRHVKKAFGRRRPAAITHDDVARWHRAMADEPTGANRRLWMLSKLLDEAERTGVRTGPNPCRHVKRYPEKARQRFLSAAELARVGDALANLEASGKVSRYAAAAIRMLLFTGCRVREILTLQWGDVDLDNGIANLRDAKAGARAVFLPAPALEVIESLPRVEDNPYLIVGQKKGEPMTTIQRPWRRVREAAKVSDVRLHDLRHTTGGWSATGGDSLLVVGALLGHRQASSTERYAHLAQDRVRQASERVGAAIAAALEGEGADVVAIEARR